MTLSRILNGIDSSVRTNTETDGLIYYIPREHPVERVAQPFLLTNYPRYKLNDIVTDINLLHAQQDSKMVLSSTVKVAFTNACW